jgi:hypothetical protein
MSFRTAYSGQKTGKKPSKPQGYFRDPTPEEWEKRMQEYYQQHTQNRYTKNQG